MADDVPAETPQQLVKLFNRSTQPQVPADVGWGGGVVMPGEYFETENPDGYQPGQAGSPWTEDAEAAQALLSLSAAQQGDTPTVPSDSPTEGDSGAENAPRASISSLPDSGFHPNLPLDHPQQPQGLKVEANGDVVNDAGQVVGRVEQTPSQEAN